MDRLSKLVCSGHWGWEQVAYIGILVSGFVVVVVTSSPNGGLARIWIIGTVIVSGVGIRLFRTKVRACSPTIPAPFLPSEDDESDQQT